MNKKTILKGGNSSKNQNIKLCRPNRSGRGDRSSAIWLRDMSGHDQRPPGPAGQGARVLRGAGVTGAQRVRGALLVHLTRHRGRVQKLF